MKILYKQTIKKENRKFRKALIPQFILLPLDFYQAKGTSEHQPRKTLKFEQKQEDWRA